MVPACNWNYALSIIVLISARKKSVRRTMMMTPVLSLRQLGPIMFCLLYIKVFCCAILSCICAFIIIGACSIIAATRLILLF